MDARLYEYKEMICIDSDTVERDSWVTQVKDKMFIIGHIKMKINGKRVYSYLMWIEHASFLSLLRGKF